MLRILVSILTIFGKPLILVHSCCYNKTTMNRVAYKQQTFIYHSSRNKEVQDHGTSNVVVWWDPMSKIDLLHVFSHSRREQLALWGLFCCWVTKLCWLFVTPWTVAHQAPLSMGFSRQEYWSGLPFFSPGESSQPRDWTRISRTGRQSLYHWATMEAPRSFFHKGAKPILRALPSFLIWGKINALLN